MEFPTWKTLKLNRNLRTAKSYQKEAAKKAMKIDSFASDVIDVHALSAKAFEGEAELVVVTVEDLGFYGAVTLKEIYSCARGLGLDLCPAVFGPQLRLQYKDQADSESLVMAMEPIDNSDEKPCLFRLSCICSVCWLYVSHYRRGDLWDLYHSFVFCRRKQQ